MRCPLQGTVVSICRSLRMGLVLGFKNFSCYSVALSCCCTETSYWCEMFIAPVQNGPGRVLLPHPDWSPICGLALLAGPLGDLVMLTVSSILGRPAWAHSHGRGNGTHIAQGFFEAQAGNSSSIFSLHSISQSKTRYQTRWKRSSTWFYLII